MSRALGRQDILDAPDELPRLRVETPEWGGHVYVALLRTRERVAMEHAIAELPPGSQDLIPLVVARTVVDEAGAAVFTDDDIKRLHDKAAPPVMRVFKVAMEHNRVGDAEVTRAQGESEPSRS